MHNPVQLLYDELCCFLAGRLEADRLVSGLADIAFVKL